MAWSRLRYFPYLLGFLACWSVSAIAAELGYPLSIAVSESGIVYLADRDLPGIWKLEGEKLTLFYQGSRQFRTPLNAIRCVALDRDGRLLAGDSSTREVYRFNDENNPVGLTRKVGPEPATPTPSPPNAAKSAEKKKTDPEGCDDKPSERGAPPPAHPKYVFGEIGIPMDIAVDKTGNLFVSDLEIHRIVKVAKEGGAVQEFVQIQAPRGLCLDSEEHLWVVAGRKLVRVSPAGEKTTVVEDGTFRFPHTVAVGTDKTAYVCDGYEKCIWKVPPGGKPTKLVSGEPLVNPVGMRLVADKLYVVDPRAKAVFQVTLDGKIASLPMKP